MYSQTERTSRLHLLQGCQAEQPSCNSLDCLHSWLDRAVASITLVILAVSLFQPAGRSEVLNVHMQERSHAVDVDPV